MAAAPKHRTPAQNSQMWGLVAQLRRLAGLSEDDAAEVLRKHCREISGQEHSSKLTVRQAEAVIARMAAEVGGYHGKRPAPARLPWGRRGDGPREDQRISPRQQQVLQALFVQAGLDTRERQMGFSRRQCGQPWPQTQSQADAIFEPLKAMVMRRLQPSDALARFQALAGRPGLDKWKRDFVADVLRQFGEAQDIATVMSPHKLLKLIECELAVEAEEEA